MSIVGSPILNRHSEVLSAVPSVPRDEDGPVFREPWEAQAFAMAIALHGAGHFTWPEWANALGAEISAAGAEQSGEDYYLCWLSALEKLVGEKKIAASSELLDRKAAWDRAARATPHGEPIELGRELTNS